MKRVAIQGYKGCFHEQAARLFYGNSVVPVECDTFPDLYAAFDLLRRQGKQVKGEVYIRIGQNLMALPGQRLEDIREVRTHYMAINQTRPWFEEHAPWIRLIESEDTAKSAARLAASGEKGVGAVAGELAAQLYGLEILAPGIETHKQNFTRFLILDDQMEVPQEQMDKALLCFTLPHKPGSLAHILTILSFYEMNLTRIQSLPIPGREWQYFFYIDIKFANYLRYTQALTAVRPLLEDLEVLGEYKAAL